MASLWIKATAYVPKSIATHETAKTFVAQLKQRTVENAGAQDAEGAVVALSQG